MINIKENEKLSIMNHSCAHLLAQAVKHLYPEAKFWVGPVVEEGFYYDIDLNGKTLTEEDIPAIEKEMKKIAEKLPMKKKNKKTEQILEEKSLDESQKNEDETVEETEKKETTKKKVKKKNTANEEN